MATCYNHKEHGNFAGKEKRSVSTIPLYIQWNNSSWSLKKRYVAIGEVCPQCNRVFFYDRNDFGDFVA